VQISVVILIFIVNYLFFSLLIFCYLDSFHCWRLKHYKKIISYIGRIAFARALTDDHHNEIWKYDKTHPDQWTFSYTNKAEPSKTFMEFP